MTKSGLIDIYILEILEKYANESHRMYQKDILRHLWEDYEVEINRNTLTSYIKELKSKKYITGDRGLYRTGKFSDQELRILIDGVLYGQHIPVEDAMILINKLKSLSEIGLKDNVKNVYYLEGINHTQNKRINNIILKIDEAIQKNKKIRVQQCRYNADKKLVKTGKEFIMDPYQLVPEKSRYYLICFVEEYESGHHGAGLENHRIDRFWDVEILDDIRKKIETIPPYNSGKPFMLDEYLKEHIYMWSGDSKRVKLRISNYGIGDFIDWYGTDFKIDKRGDDYLDISFVVNENAILYWALQYGKIATVLEPKEVRAKVSNAIDEMQKRYK